MIVICEKCKGKIKCLHRKPHKHCAYCDWENVEYECLTKNRRGCVPIGCLRIEKNESI